MNGHHVGDWVKNGKKYGALMFQLEHRYYGQSIPFMLRPHLAPSQRPSNGLRSPQGSIGGQSEVAELGAGPRRHRRLHPCHEGQVGHPQRQGRRLRRLLLGYAGPKPTEPPSSCRCPCLQGPWQPGSVSSTRTSRTAPLAPAGPSWPRPTSSVPSFPSFFGPCLLGRRKGS